MGGGLGLTAGEARSLGLANGDSSFIGVSGLGELAMGGTVWNGMVIGGVVASTVVSSPKYDTNRFSATGGNITLVHVGPLIDWYFMPSRGFHASFSPGLVLASAARGTTVPTFPSSAHAGSGGGVIATIGYDWWVAEQWSIGVALRTSYFVGTLHSDELVCASSFNDTCTFRVTSDLATNATTLGALFAATYH